MNRPSLTELLLAVDLSIAAYLPDEEAIAAVAKTDLFGAVIPFHHNSTDGFIVIQKDRHAWIVFRGTEVAPIPKGTLWEKLKSLLSNKDVRTDLAIQDTAFCGGSAHAGMVTAWRQCRPIVYKWLERHRIETASLTGHSLGSALAQCAALDLTVSGMVTVKCVIGVAPPKPFKEDCADLYKERVGDVTWLLRVGGDLVCLGPPGGFCHGNASGQFMWAPNMLVSPDGDPFVRYSFSNRARAALIDLIAGRSAKDFALDHRCSNYRSKIQKAIRAASVVDKTD